MKWAVRVGVQHSEYVRHTRCNYTQAKCIAEDSQNVTKSCQQFYQFHNYNSPSTSRVIISIVQFVQLLYLQQVLPHTQTLLHATWQGAATWRI